MESKGAVVKRLRENPGYVTAFEARLWRNGVPGRRDRLCGHDESHRRLRAHRLPLRPSIPSTTGSCAAQYKMTDEEELGRVLFFSNQFTNCNTCHQLKAACGRRGRDLLELRVPQHRCAGEHGAALPPMGRLPGRVDLGLLDTVNGKGDAAQKGKFKTPTLRNVAVTGPYMHNGVFNDLRTVILFYNKYNSKAPRRQINPETGAAWAPPEVPENISREELEFGPALKDREIDALVAFLKTLTDQRHEPLIK